MAYHHGQLQRALLDAALEMVREDGPKGLSLRGAARRAGVSSAAPYRHFADKEALLAALAQEGFELLVTALETVAARHADDPIERLLRIGIAYVTFATAHPARFKVMFGNDIADRTAYPELDAVALRAFGALGDAVSDIDARGRLRGSVGAATLLAWSVVHGLASLLVDGQARIPTEPAVVTPLAEQLGQLLLDGVVVPDA